jgi:peptidoglycan/LPS O-acetylase OafA/YrhL
MAYLVGTYIGLILACLPIYLLGLLVGLFLKDKEPEERAMYAGMGAWLLAYVLAGFGKADGGSFRFDAGLLYIPAALIAFFMLRHHYRRMWKPDEEELARTFE